MGCFKMHIFLWYFMCWLCVANRITSLPVLIIKLSNGEYSYAIEAAGSIGWFLGSVALVVAICVLQVN